MIDVEIVFATSADAKDIWQKKIQLPTGATIAQALLQSGFFEQHEAQWHDAPCGIFGVQRDRDHLLKDGDQVEIYRTLVFDPMESRRRRAAHRAKQAEQKQKTTK